jgi:hypothetical protein
MAFYKHLLCCLLVVAVIALTLTRIDSYTSWLERFWLGFHLPACCVVLIYFAIKTIAIGVREILRLEMTLDALA